MKLARREDVCGDLVSIILHAMSPKQEVGGEVYTYRTDKQLDLDWVLLDALFFILFFERISKAVVRNREMLEMPVVWSKDEPEDDSAVDRNE